MSPDVANIDVCAQAGGANAALVKTVYSVPISDGKFRVSRCRIVRELDVADVGLGVEPEKPEQLVQPKAKRR